MSYTLFEPTTSTTVTLYNVTADTFTDEYETGELLLLGRGRRIEFGTRWGARGTLTVQLFDEPTVPITAVAQRTAIQALKELRVSVAMTNPFGDVLAVVLGDIQFERIPGVGNHDYMTVTIPYVEVM